MREKNEKAVLDSLKDMREAGIPQNGGLYSVALCGLVKMGGKKSALQLYNSMVENKVNYYGCGSHTGPVRTLLAFGKVDDALEIYSKYERPIDRQAFTALLSGLAQHGRYTTAIDILHKERVSDADIYCSLISALLAAHEEKHAFALFQEMQHKNLEICTLQAFTTVVNVLFHNGQVEEALKWLEKMKQETIQPSAVTHAVVLEGLVNGGRLDQALRYFDDMRKGIPPRIYPIQNFEWSNEEHDYPKTDLTPNAFHYNCIIHGFIQAGRERDAERMVEQMKKAGIRPNGRTYDLLTHCAHNGSITVRMLVFLCVCADSLK